MAVAHVPWMPVQEVCPRGAGVGAAAPDALLPGIWKPSGCEWWLKRIRYDVSSFLCFIF